MITIDERGRFRLKLHCTCGFSMTGTVPNRHAAYKIYEAYRQFHTGSGHEPCDAKTAAETRDREEQEAIERETGQAR